MKHQNFKIEVAKSNIDWVGRKVTGAHNGTINIKEGKLTADDGQLSSGNFIVDTTSIKILDVTDPALNKQFAGHLASDDFFSSADFPEAAFEITSVKNNRVEGKLTISGVIDGNKKQVYECVAGDLLFHHWDDPHYNVGTKTFTRGFHVEITREWLTLMNISIDSLKGSYRVHDPGMKILMANILKESKLKSSCTQLAVDMLLLEIFSALQCKEISNTDTNPPWVKKVREALHEIQEDFQLIELAKIADVHPVHLSRSFNKYFKTTMGNYLRDIKIQRGLSLLTDKNLSLTAIAQLSGFADQSHFIRSFKNAYYLTPLKYRKLLLK